MPDNCPQKCTLYFDHNANAGVKGQARRFVDCVLAASGRASRRGSDLPPSRLLLRLSNTVSPDGMEDSRRTAGRLF